MYAEESVLINKRDTITMLHARPHVTHVTRYLRYKLQNKLQENWQNTIQREVLFSYSSNFSLDYRLFNHVVELFG